MIQANQAKHSIVAMCKVLQVSRSGYHDWHHRGPSQRRKANANLVEHIKESHAASDGTYGMPRIRMDLLEKGIVASRKRIARLMREQGISGVSRRRAWCVTTERNKRQRPAPDLVNRRFIADGMNQLWVADMTYLPTWEGFLYLAIVLDVFSRKVVGWAFGKQMTADLVVSALNMALLSRKPEQGLIHHSDQGSQYTSVDFRNRCQEMGINMSMGTVGDAYDNAMAESFFATLECDLIARRVWRTKAEARSDVFTWIESWYNPRRRHSGVGHKSPNCFEKEYVQKINNTAELAGHSKHGLPTGCFAPVDKSSLAIRRLPPTCPQAGPMDKPVTVC